MGRLLDRVDTPAELAGFSLTELDALAGELRERIIGTVSHTGGHLAASLGVVELTIALLRVFAPPRDKVVWDTGHQCYAWKLLTGRRDRFASLRQHDGLSGFLRPAESEYDAFGAGHAGTALSAALGMAVARDRTGGNEHVVAVIGDASASCGISLEAMNNVAGTTSRLIVVLNDNEMSISENVGSISRYLGGLLANPRYNRWKRSVERMAERLHMGWCRSVYYRMEEAVKSLFLRSIFFEEFGLRYIGPIDGHSLPALQDALTIARESTKPILLHVSTRKGQGYAYAEAQPSKWHGTPCFDVESGQSLGSTEGPSWSTVAGRTIERLASEDERVVAITAAMCAGTGLSSVAARFPKRFFDVGICEEHAAVFAAGMAIRGLRPFYAVYSTFAQRCVDNIIHDICLQELPVTVCLDRAGVVGDDGPTHNGVFDIALLRCIPNLLFMQPADEAELANMLYTALKAERPAVIRYPRGTAPGVPVPHALEYLPIGKAVVVREGTDIQIWALGDMLPLAERIAGQLAGDGLSVGIVNPRFISPLDTELLAKQTGAARAIVTLENGIATGGLGSAIQDVVGTYAAPPPVVRCGWPDGFVPQGKPAELMERYGLTDKAIVQRVRDRLAEGRERERQCPTQGTKPPADSLSLSSCVPS